MGKFFGLEVERVLRRDFAARVEEAEDVLIVFVTKGAEQSSDEELTTTATAIEVNPEEVILVELNFDPGATVRNDTEGVQRLTAGVL